MSAQEYEYVVTDEDVADEWLQFRTSPDGCLTPAQKAIVVMKLTTRRFLSSSEVEACTGITKPDRYYRKGKIMRDRCRLCGGQIEYIEYRDDRTEADDGGYWKHARPAVDRAHPAEPAFSGGS